MVSYIGSWLGGPAKSANAARQLTGTTDALTEAEDESNSFDGTE